MDQIRLGPNHTLDQIVVIKGHENRPYILPNCIDSIGFNKKLIRSYNSVQQFRPLFGPTICSTIQSYNLIRHVMPLHKISVPGTIFVHHFGPTCRSTLRPHSLDHYSVLQFDPPCHGTLHKISVPRIIFVPHFGPTIRFHMSGLA